MASIEIFKPGTLTSMEGVQVTLSAADLQDIAAGYDPKRHEAPMVIGHPTHDAPAYGWVKSLAFADGALVAQGEESAELTELVGKGHFKKVSASFYTPKAPGNPTPGKWSLRHVGFLGAQPPAVKGLRAVSFAEAEEGVVTFGELPGYAGGMVAGMFRRIRDWLIAEKGQDVADRVLPDWEVESLRSVSQRAAEEPEDEPQGGTPGLSFADPSKAATHSAAAGRTAGASTDSPTARQENASMSKTPEQLQADLDAANARVQELQAAEAKRASDTRHAEHVSFAEKLVTEARWPAGAKDVLVATLDHLAQPEGVVSFGEGDAAKPLHQALREQLQAMPVSVSFGEFAKKGDAAGGGLTNQQVADRASAYQARRKAAGQNISMSEAVDAVNAGTDKD